MEGIIKLDYLTIHVMYNYVIVCCEWIVDLGYSWMNVFYFGLAYCGYIINFHGLQKHKSKSLLLHKIGILCGMPCVYVNIEYIKEFMFI